MLLSGLGLPHIWTVPVAAQTQAQGAERGGEPIGKRKFQEVVNSKYIWVNPDLLPDRQSKPSQAAASSSEIQRKPDAEYGGWYPNLPSAQSNSKNDSSNGGDISDPNAIDI